MFHVILTRDGEVIKDLDFQTFKEARNDFNRQARNAWRRRGAWLQVQYNLAYKMSWHEKTGHYYLELK